MAEDESVLIKALPPESDYLTYCTIVEYNLTTENLPILHKVLQDEKLTTNIGWDLVHLLVPYLPESEQCLQDIARLGNPREVILKVTECLRLIDYDTSEAEREVSRDALADVEDPRVRAESSTYPVKTAPTSGERGEQGSSQMVELPPPLPLAVNQFVSLLSMLSVLHARVKTKYPSRFLSSTLQAILASFSKATTHREEMVLAIVKTIKAVTGVQRPALPSRKSSGMLGSVSASSTSAPAADPEGITDAEITLEEKAIQERLLQSFVTHVVEEYVLNLPEYGDVPGLAWSSRLMEKMHPKRIIPNTKTYTSRFQNEEKLHRRIDASGQLLTLAQDLKLSDDVLLASSIVMDNTAATGGEYDEPPASADDIALSRLGSLILYTAREAACFLYEKTSRTGRDEFFIFPNHLTILKQCLSTSVDGINSVGTEPEPLIDAILALGLICLDRDTIGDPGTDEVFNEYLQIIALLASNCPNSNLRGHAHYLASTVLRSQPDDEVRLAFIRDTLEHCPFENLKVSAIGWVKDEILEANPPTPLAGLENDSLASTRQSIFSNPILLERLSPFIFPNLHGDLVAAPLPEAWSTFQANSSFYAAGLNFLYLLLSAKHLNQPLGFADLWYSANISRSFLQPLQNASKRFRDEIAEGGSLHEEANNGVMAELSLLNDALERVSEAAKYINEV
ncbi:hypothetical protein M433DRAFT_132770 [Acidomyces richmondensis BFW]|nr:MAG: hypothetical protein FE78DRAFT_67951 [Acidomyces sp. 'richmondensis']KYG47694.1 hypothetical protein M433DRAFT_132770 [Acidomyces richmondensis BFW]